MTFLWFTVLKNGWYIDNQCTSWLADKALCSMPEKYPMSLQPKILCLELWFSRKRLNISILLKSQCKQIAHIKRLMWMLFVWVCFAPRGGEKKKKKDITWIMFKERCDMQHTKCPWFPVVIFEGCKISIIIFWTHLQLGAWFLAWMCFS